MPQVDTSMYSNMQAPDILGGIQKGMQLRQMYQQQQIAQKALDFQNTLKGAYQPDPTTGQLTFNPQKLGDLANIDPQKAFDLQQQMKAGQVTTAQQQAELHHLQLGDMASILGSANDQGSYDNAVKQATDKGYLHQGEAPAAYDPNWVKTYAGRALSYQDQLAEQHKISEQNTKQQQADAETAKAAAETAKVPIEQTKADASIQANALERNRQHTQDYSKELQQTQQMLESARGNPEVSQALTDRMAAKKLTGIIGTDPDKASPQMVQLAASEVAKIATGGVPQSAELQHLTPSSIPGSLASAAQYVSNHPTSANQGAFLKQYQDYANHIGTIANGTIKDKFSRVIESKRPYLHPADYATLNSTYLDPLSTQRPGAPPPPKVGSLEDGHVFMGGDPSKPESWKAQ